jgi:hypothetical protein
MQPTECPVCYENVLATRLFRCKHVLCMACCAKLRAPSCPMCRAHTMDRIHVIIPGPVRSALDSLNLQLRYAAQAWDERVYDVFVFLQDATSGCCAELWYSNSTACTVSFVGYDIIQSDQGMHNALGFLMGVQVEPSVRFEGHIEECLAKFAESVVLCCATAWASPIVQIA